MITYKFHTIERTYSNWCKMFCKPGLSYKILFIVGAVRVTRYKLLQFSLHNYSFNYSYKLCQNILHHKILKNHHPPILFFYFTPKKPHLCSTHSFSTIDPPQHSHIRELKGVKGVAKKKIFQRDLPPDPIVSSHHWSSPNSNDGRSSNLICKVSIK